MTPILLVLTGILVCVVSIQAMRMVQAGWAARVEKAHRDKGGHVVWRPADRLAVAFWCVGYGAGAACVIAGLALAA